jgi:hypothetical protein
VEKSNQACPTKLKTKSDALWVASVGWDFDFFRINQYGDRERKCGIDEKISVEVFEYEHDGTTQTFVVAVAKSRTAALMGAVEIMDRLDREVEVDCHSVDSTYSAQFVASPWG